MTMSSLHELIKRRRSHVAFTEQEIDYEQLEALFQSARWAASCFNEQPWRFIFALRRDTQNFRRILHCLDEGNQIWAKYAAVLLIAVARKNFSHNETPNRHAHHDLGQAMATFALRATDFGLSLHQMAGFDMQKAQVELGIPQPFEAWTAAALGFPGNVERLTDELKEREQSPRQRKPLHELVFQGTWGNAFSMESGKTKQST